MTIGIRITLPGVTQDQFDEVNSRIDPKNNPPKGILFHASGPVDGGWSAIDFWDSREDFDAFQGRIGAAAEAAGVEMSGPPQIEEFPVYETLQAASQDAFPERAEDPCLPPPGADPSCRCRPANAHQDAR